MQKYAIVLLLWIYQTRHVLSAGDCPPPNRKCDCRDSLQGYVYCRGMTSLPRFLPSNITLLDLNLNQLGSSLQKKQMDKLGCSSLNHLYMSGAGLEAIESKTFLHHPSLRTLDLSRNQLTHLEDKTFFGLVHLESLFLSGSSIHDISPRVFTYTPSLRYLDLANNKLTSVTTEFSKLTSLKTLILSRNQISIIADSSLNNLIHLNHLDISGNDLTIPEPQLFEHLVANNGTTRIKAETTNNRWDCCGLKALEYHDFISDFSLNIDEQFDVRCSTPSKWAGQRLSEIRRSDLVESECDEKRTSLATPGRLLRKFTNLLDDGTDTISTASTESGESETTASTTKQQVILSKFKGSRGTINSFSRLSDGQIALILVAIVVLVIVITAFIVRQCVIEKRKKAFGEFVDNLPNAIEVDEDDTLTTKTYRHDAPVYGSTGNVIDRHRRKTDFASYSASKVKELPANTTGQSQRRKPPPYDPPSSPEGFAEAYEKPNFNNNASNISATVVTDDFYGYQKMLRRIASCPTEYDSDDGNVLWNVKNVK